MAGVTSPRWRTIPSASARTPHRAVSFQVGDRPFEVARGSGACRPTRLRHGMSANHLMKSVLPHCTYEAFDTGGGDPDEQPKVRPALDGRLKTTRSDSTNLPIEDGIADLVLVCETHVTEMPGQVTDEDQRPSAPRCSSPACSCGRTRSRQHLAALLDFSSRSADAGRSLRCDRGSDRARSR